MPKRLRYPMLQPADRCPTVHPVFSCPPMPFSFLSPAASPVPRRHHVFSFSFQPYFGSARINKAATADVQTQTKARNVRAQEVQTETVDSQVKAKGDQQQVRDVGAASLYSITAGRRGIP